MVSDSEDSLLQAVSAVLPLPPPLIQICLKFSFLEPITVSPLVDNWAGAYSDPSMDGIGFAAHISGAKLCALWHAPNPFLSAHDDATHTASGALTAKNADRLPVLVFAETESGSIRALNLSTRMTLLATPLTDLARTLIRHAVVGLVAVTTFGTAAAARFKTPFGVCINPRTNDLLFTDSMDECVRAIDARTGAVSLVAGDVGVSGSRDGVGAQARFRAPMGILCDSKGESALVCDYRNNLLRDISLKTARVVTVSGSGEKEDVDGFGDEAMIARPFAAVWHTGPTAPDGMPDRTLYVCAQWAIRIYDALTTELRTLSTTPTTDLRPVNAVFVEPSTLVVSAMNPNGFVAVNVLTGAVTPFPGLDANALSPLLEANGLVLLPGDSNSACADVSSGVDRLYVVHESSISVIAGSIIASL